MLNDLAYIDISKDKEIEGEPESFQLHRINQYTLQYLLYSIKELQIQNDVTAEKDEIYSAQLAKEKTILDQQDKKIAQLKKEIELLESKNQHEKYLIEQERPKASDNDERIGLLIDRLKEGNTIIDGDLQHVKNFKNSIMETKSQFNIS